jgi:UPF0755 protein
LQIAMWRNRIITALLGLTALTLAIALGAYLWALSAINAAGPLTVPATVIVERGAGLAQIARQLAQARVIANPALFQFEARRARQSRLLKPGEYRFDAGVSVVEVLDKLTRHDVVARFVTIPEGLVTAEILAILDGAEGLTGTVTESPADGTLLPETYRYEWGDERAALIGRMVAARDAALAERWDARRRDLPIATPDEAVVLASIVEKETGVASERGRVAAVFVNRLNKRMRLQSDPTVIYGLKPGGLDRPLTRADLDTPTSYNTYLIDRLPPGPICHPGREALAAVLNPPETSDLYFVADGSGGHAFGASLDEHNRNVARWRKIEARDDDPRQSPAAAARQPATRPNAVPRR